MPDIQKVSIALTAKQIAALKAAVETGEYATTSEIVREALREGSSKGSCAGKTSSACVSSGMKARQADARSQSTW
jgi:Arc/MetJ-type ribon-helix-helix transcriptional regulator